MKLIRYALTGSIYWLLDPLEDRTIDFEPTEGWSFISPLVYPSFEVGVGTFVTSIDGKLFMLSSELRFLAPVDYEGNGTEHNETIIRFLEALRYRSGQAEMPISLMVTMYSNIDGLPDHILPTASTTSQMEIMRKYTVDTAVDMEDVRTAMATMGDEIVSICYTMLFEAMIAAAGSDHRKAILYTAIALESMANIKLDEAYAAAKQLNPFPQHLRLRTIQLGGGNTEVQDQVYSRLLTTKEDFAQLLHVRPLYLLGRSLKFDNEELYMQAVNLYLTRNKLAHSGELPAGNQDLLPLTRDGAESALEIAIKVFRWFGEGAALAVPKMEPYRVARLEGPVGLPGLL